MDYNTHLACLAASSISLGKFPTYQCLVSCVTEKTKNEICRKCRCKMRHAFNIPSKINDGVHKDIDCKYVQIRQLVSLVDIYMVDKYVQIFGRLSSMTDFWKVLHILDLDIFTADVSLRVTLNQIW